MGYLPWSERSFRSIHREDISPPITENQSDIGEDRFEKLYEQIAKNIRLRYRPIRGRPIYFYQRRLLQSMDRLPGWATVGLDFEFLLRKR